jgi:hypothetical protein
VTLYGNLIVGPSLGLFANSSVLFVATGGENDTVDLSYNVAHGNIFASLGAGNDTLNLGGNVGSGFASADGGNGGNLLNLFGNQFAGTAFSNF